MVDMMQYDYILKAGSFRFIVVLALIFFMASCGCGDDDDDDDSDDDSGPGADDDDSDDDFWPDDDTTQYEGLEHIEIDPPIRAIPKGLSKAFSATAYFEGGTSITQAEFHFSTSDESILTVDEEGFATGVKSGTATLFAKLGDIMGEAQVVVGPDIFYFDGIAGVVGSYDRGRDRVNDDHFQFGDPIAQNPLDMHIWKTHAYIVDGGGAAVDDSPVQDIVILDLASGDYQTLIVPGLESPRDIKIVDDQAFVTGSMSDNFARIDLVDLTSEIYQLPEGCSPNGLEVISGRAFVTCNYFDAEENTYGDPGRVADVNLQSRETTLIDSTQVNPGNLALSSDWSSLYVVCTGNYAALPGVIDEIDVTSGEILDSFALGNAPGDIAINSDGLGFISENLGGDVYVIDTGNNTILRGTANPIEIEGAWWTFHIRISPFTGNVFVGDWINSKTVVLDPLNFSIVDKISTDNAGGYIFWE